MNSLLRSRIALFAILGAFLIPIGMSSLRGLTHVLTCSEEAEQPFSMIIPEEGNEVIIQSSLTLSRDQTAGLCGGLEMSMGARITEDNQVVMELPITNNTEFPWRGTVKLLLGSTSIPVDIGHIDAGDTVTDTVEFSLDPGTFELNGSLLIGP